MEDFINMEDFRNKLQQELALVPKKPGCYQMRNSDNIIIYVGKAKVLANRLKSYFTGSHDAKTTKMVSEIASFEYIITNSELEALLLEINFIKEYRPKYNILLMDDKTYPYICLTSETHPRLLMVRDNNNNRRKKLGKLFGPYPNAQACRQTVEELNKLYPFRKCNQIPKKECLYYYLNNCLAPCINQVDPNSYQEMKNNVAKILNGNNKELLNLLTSKMDQAAINLEFEKAIEYRNRINNLQMINDEQKMTLNDGINRDILGYYTESDIISIQLFHMRRGELIKRSGEVFDLNDDIEDIIVSYIAQFYQNRQNLLPNELLIPPLQQVELLKELLKIKVIIPYKGIKKNLQKLVTENAKANLENLQKQRIQKISKTTDCLNELATLLNISYPKYIELFDNSNLQGTSSISAMVTYIDGNPSRQHYRKYKVKDVVGANDYQTMIEVATRRYKSIHNKKGIYPNLIIADGGKIQVQAIKSVLDHYQITDINVIGLVKDHNHKTRAIINSQCQEIPLDSRSNLYLLLESMQDEVHRFAINYFRMIHTKSAIESQLDKIKGMGEIRKKTLLTNFNNLEEIKNASEQSLKELGIPQKVIDQIKKMKI